MRTILPTIKISLMMFFATVAFMSRAVFAYSDVGEGSPFFVPVDSLNKSGLISGYTDGTFKPWKNITREEAVAFVLGNVGTGTEASGTTTRPFKDVTAKNPYFDEILEAKERGLVSGFQDGKYFRPKKSINLAEMLHLLFATKGVATEMAEFPIPDGVPVDSWYAKDIAYAVGTKMLMQKENGAIFPPERALRRGEFALLLYRFFEIQKGAEFGFASWYGDGLSHVKLSESENADYKRRFFTAANLKYPFGTLLRVTNMANGKQTVVVVDDRGPYVTGRIIDLSRTAFSALQSPGAGIISVKVEPSEPEGLATK